MSPLPEPPIEVRFLDSVGAIFSICMHGDSVLGWAHPALFYALTRASDSTGATVRRKWVEYPMPSATLGCAPAAGQSTPSATSSGLSGSSAPASSQGYCRMNQTSQHMCMSARAGSRQTRHTHTRAHTHTHAHPGVHTRAHTLLDETHCYCTTTR